MFKASMVKYLKEEILKVKKELSTTQEIYKIKLQEVDSLKMELSMLIRESNVKKEEAIAELRKEMQKSLVESDLLRSEALAKLGVYEKIDTKADANIIKEMVNKLIDVIGNKKDINVIK